MKKKSYLVIIGLFILSLVLNSTLAQGTETFDDQAKLIRIKKIANEWQGAVLTLETRNGQIIKGRLIEVSAGSYHLATGATKAHLSLVDVVKVSYEPGIPEMLLSFGSAVMGSAFLTGAILIAKDDASDADVSRAALLGLLAGGYWGVSTFYESEVIYVE